MLLLTGLCRMRRAFRVEPHRVNPPVTPPARSGSPSAHLSTGKNHEPNPNARGEDQPEGSGQVLEKRALSQQEKFIHLLHQEACRAGKLTYVDPLSGCKVFTEIAHKQRGSCCGSACRHCPYGQINVDSTKKKKTFNSLFYV